MSFRTPKARVVGLGSARGGTHHWWTQRLSSIALLPLTVLFVVPFAGALGEGFEATRALYSHPFHAIVGVLFIAVTFHHLAQGLQVVIEDYVHAKGWRTGLLIANTMFNTVAGAAGVFAILKIAFSA